MRSSATRSRTPFYAFIGKKTVSFGDFSTLSPFTQAVPWHYFAALGEQAGVGYVNDGFHAVVTGINGGAGSGWWTRTSGAT